MPHISMTGAPIALAGDTVDKLISRGNGDAALLYIYLLRTGGEYSSSAAQSALGWNAARVLSAFTHLVELGLAEDNTPPARKNAPKPEHCPNYTTEDISSELSAEGSSFKALLEEVEHLLGRKCSLTDTRILLELYDHLAMPPEVLLIITARQIEECEMRFGPGRRPRVSEIKAMAYRWKRLGVDTLEAAEERLIRMNYLRSQEGGLLEAVGITNRMAVDAEQRYLHQWTEWGFGPEAAKLAYERTILRKGAMNWPYCNGILRRWHEKNAHTPAEIEALEHSAKAPKKASPPTDRNRGGVTVPSNARKNAEWMRRMLEEDPS